MATRAGSGGRPGSGSASFGATPGPEPSYRVLMYSHDSFGLGHLRRCRAIAHALVARHRKLTVLILTGSPVIGRFSLRARVDFVRVPGVIKLRNGDYSSLNLDVNVRDTLALRASIIEHTARVFRPHLFLVDKEPLGLLGEARRTLQLMRRLGNCRLVLGLRDVMDEPVVLAEEWQRKRVIPALERLYDHIWIYGLPEIYDPIRAYRFPPRVAAKAVFTGYLEREPPAEVSFPSEVARAIAEGPFLLVTPGGGGDGAELIDAVLSAYERFEARLPWPALIVYGPFLPAHQRAAFERRAACLPRVTTLTFYEHLESLMEKAAAVACLGGYNTFCEVLSLRKRSLIVPRVTPRAEQLLRAEAAEKLGLVRMLHPTHLNPVTLTDALVQLRDQLPPPTERIPGLLHGLSYIGSTVAHWRLEGRDGVAGGESRGVSGRRPAAAARLAGRDAWPGALTVAPGHPVRRRGTA